MCTNAMYDIYVYKTRISYICKLVTFFFYQHICLSYIKRREGERREGEEEEVEDTTKDKKTTGYTLYN